MPGLPAGLGPGGFPGGLPDGLGGDQGFRLPPGFATPQPNVPPGLRNKRGRSGKKGR